jgi:hypothetical protein
LKQWGVLNPATRGGDAARKPGMKKQGEMQLRARSGRHDYVGASRDRFSSSGTNLFAGKGADCLLHTSYSAQPTVGLVGWSSSTLLGTIPFQQLLCSKKNGFGVRAPAGSSFLHPSSILIVTMLLSQRQH